jgi:hypothetical protein
MGFGLSIERSFAKEDVIEDLTPGAPIPGPMPLPPNEIQPDALPPTNVTYIGPSPSNPPTAPDDAFKNVVPLASGITAGGILVFLVVVMIYFFFCRKNRPDEESTLETAPALTGDGRVRITGMNPRFDDLNTNLG